MSNINLPERNPFMVYFLLTWMTWILPKHNACYVACEFPILFFFSTLLEWTSVIYRITRKWPIWPFNLGRPATRREGLQKCLWIVWQVCGNREDGRGKQVSSKQSWVAGCKERGPIHWFSSRPPVTVETLWIRLHARLYGEGRPGCHCNVCACCNCGSQQHSLALTGIIPTTCIYVLSLVISALSVGFYSAHS